jgi:hypothetical protein
MVASNCNNEMISGGEVAAIVERHETRMKEVRIIAEPHFKRLFKKPIDGFWISKGLDFDQFEKELIVPFQKLGEEMPDTAVRVYGQEARDLIGKISEMEIRSLKMMKEDFRG